MLIVNLSSTHIENHKKHSLLTQTDLSVESTVFNFRVTCQNEKTVFVNALDMVSISEFFERAVLGYVKPQGSQLPYNCATFIKLLSLLYLGWGEYETVQEVILLHELSDYLGIEYCTHSFMSSLRKYMKECLFHELLQIYDVAERHSEHKLAKLVVNTLVEEYRFEDIAEDVANHCEFLFGEIITSDRLDIASELVLARLLLETKNWASLTHVRVEHLHEVELSALLKEQQTSLEFTEILRDEACCRLERNRGIPSRLPRGIRYVWVFKEEISHLIEFPNVKMCLLVENGKFNVCTSSVVEFTIFYSLQFVRVHKSSPQWEQVHSWFRYSVPDLVLDPKQSHFICIKLS